MLLGTLESYSVYGVTKTTGAQPGKRLTLERQRLTVLN